MSRCSIGRVAAQTLGVFVVVLLYTTFGAPRPTSHSSLHSTSAGGSKRFAASSPRHAAPTAATTERSPPDIGPHSASSAHDATHDVLLARIAELEARIATSEHAAVSAHPEPANPPIIASPIQQWWAGSSSSPLRVVYAFPPRFSTLDALRAATPLAAQAPCLPLLRADGAFDSSGIAALNAAPGLSAAAFTVELARPDARPLGGAGAVDVNSGGILEWARVRALHASVADDNAHVRRPRARMGSRSRRALCSAPHLLRDPVSSLFLPAGGCGSLVADANSPAAANLPDENEGSDVYLQDPAEWVSVLSGECAVAEQTNTDWACVFQLMHPARLHQQMGDYHSWADIFRPRLQVGLRVQEVDELAVIPPYSYPDANGHFFYEALSNYHILDAMLPARIPLLVALPPHFVATIEQLRGLGVLRTDRPAIYVGPREKTLVRARRTFYIRSPARSYNHTPFMSTTAFRMLNAAFLRGARTRFGASPGVADAEGITDDMRLRAVLLNRPAGTGRSVEARAVEAAVRAALPNLRSFDAIVPTNDVEPLARLLPRACLVIGPHGANLQNLFWVQPGCWIIEIGYIAVPGAFKLPHSFHGASRAMNMTYFVSYATAGNHDIPLTVDADDLAEIFGAYHTEMLAPRGLG